MNKPLRALIIEDSEDDTLLLLNHLRRKGYSVTYEQVETSETMEASINQHKWDIILSDHSMPHFSSFDALRLMKRRGFDLPFIIRNM